MKTLALTLLLTVAPTLAQACTGTVQLDANMTIDGKKTEIVIGQTIGGIDHILHDPAKGIVIACCWRHLLSGCRPIG